MAGRTNQHATPMPMSTTPHTQMMVPNVPGSPSIWSQQRFGHAGS